MQRNSRKDIVKTVVKNNSLKKQQALFRKLHGWQSSYDKLFNVKVLEDFLFPRIDLSLVRTIFEGTRELSYRRTVTFSTNTFVNVEPVSS